jgi:pseudouridine-5'-phosphate glycosidase
MSRNRVLLNTILKRKFHALPQSQKFVITPEIKEAIKNQGPVVALESTIISHGNPENVYSMLSPFF